MISGLVLTLFFTNGVISNEVMRMWEPETVLMNEIEKPFDFGILLTGFASSAKFPDDRLQLVGSGNRFMNAYELYRRGKIKKLLISGGTGKLNSKGYSEAVSVKRKLLRMGFPEQDIIIEPNSRNTYENALFSANLIKTNYPNSRCLLITSASHLRRAVGCFEKQNIRFTPFAADVRGLKRKYSISDFLIPNPKGFEIWSALIKEWVGIAAYKMKGYL